MSRLSRLVSESPSSYDDHSNFREVFPVVFPVFALVTFSVIFLQVYSYFAYLEYFAGGSVASRDRYR